MNNKTLFVRGSSGLLDLLGVVECFIDVVNKLPNVRLSVKWNRWENTFDTLIGIEKPIEYISYKKLVISPKSYKRLGSEFKNIPLQERVNTINNLFKEGADIIEIWDNRTIAKGYPTTHIFNKIKFSSRVYEKLNTYKTVLGNNYIAFHGRYTDYAYGIKDKENFCLKIENTIKNAKDNILLCTDNQMLIARFIHSNKVYNFSYIKSLFEQNIILPKDVGTHLITLPDLPNFNFNMQESAIIDLLLCIYSKEFYHGSSGSWPRFIKKMRKSLEI